MGLRVVHDCVNSRLQNRAEHGVFSFMHQVSSRGEGGGEQQKERAQEEGRSVAATRSLECACAMGITRFQINFGES